MNKQMGRRETEWGSLAWWVLATCAGWVLAAFVLGLLLHSRWVLGNMYGPYYGFALSLTIRGVLLGALFGISVGILQWFILRRHINRAALWVAAAVLGFIVGVLGGFLVFYALTGTGQRSMEYTLVPAGLIAGIMIGLFQFFVLRRYSDRAWLWLLPGVLSGWPVFFIYSAGGVSIFSLISMAGMGLALGLISGVTYFFISRRPRVKAGPPSNTTAAEESRQILIPGRPDKMRHADKGPTRAEQVPVEKPILDPAQHLIGWRFVLWWALAAFAGSILGILLFAALLGISSSLMGTYQKGVSHLLPLTIRGVITGASFGIAFGVFQWLILRKHIAHAYWWIIGTVLGLGLGTPLAFLAIEAGSSGIRDLAVKIPLGLATFVAPGIVVGAIQQLTLRQHVNWAWLWIAPSSLSWSMMILTFSESPLILVIIPALGLVTGTISGIALRFILTRRKEQ